MKISDVRLYFIRIMRAAAIAGRWPTAIYNRCHCVYS